MPVLLVLALFMSGCGDLLGSKSDSTTDEIFEAGRIEPGLINEAEYVPLFPFFSIGGDGSALQNPQDVYVGYDEFIYVVDERGLHVLDRAGRPANFIGIQGGGTSVIQDRSLDLYVTARRDTLLNGRTWNLAVVYKYTGITTGSPTISNIIWHPFDEESRRFNLPDPIDTDEEVAFTSVGILFNSDVDFANSIYVARQGPVNDRASVIRPHNTVLEFNGDGLNTNALVALSSTQASLLSSVNPTDVLTFIHPPQRSTFSDDKSFLLAQAANEGEGRLRFGVLSIRAVETPDGIVYQPDTQKILLSGVSERGDGFLYDEFKFNRPAGLAFAADASQYIFAIDSGSDSLFVFTSSGIEGVAPPPGSNSTKPVVVSFGGRGDGALQFNNPQGVSYSDRIVYVADAGNNRISRFRLNTDFE